MILDNQKQKDLLINIISTMPMNGNYQQVRDAIVVIDELLQAVANAEIKDSNRK